MSCIFYFGVNFVVERMFIAVAVLFSYCDSLHYLRRTSKILCYSTPEIFKAIYLFIVTVIVFNIADLWIK